MPAKPPPPPKFEKVPDDWWNHMTLEDRDFLEQLEREGRFPLWTEEQVRAEIAAELKKLEERLRRPGLDPKLSKKKRGDK
jgi:hypothetical protein